MTVIFEYKGLKYKVGKDLYGDPQWRLLKPGRTWMPAEPVFANLHKTYATEFVEALRAAWALLQSKMGYVYGIAHLKLTREESKAVAERAGIKVVA